MSFFSRFNKNVTAKSALVADAEKSAEWIAKALVSSGYRADFSFDSLKDVDRFFDEQTADGKARQDGLLREQLGSRLFALGAYCGEVIRRHVGGTWVDPGTGAQAEIDLGLQLRDGSMIWPVQRVMKRYQNGTEDSLYAFSVILAQKGNPSN